jgi:hypothetical protein
MASLVLAAMTDRRLASIVARVPAAVDRGPGRSVSAYSSRVPRFVPI